MVIDHRSESGQDLAAAFRDHVRRLDRPDRRRSEALRIRVNLARTSRVGLRERLARSEMSRTISH